MSYVVLARKYRSRNFSEMVGQPHVVQALSNALASQRLHHAYLFTGTRGIGKTTVSRILAKALNCVGPDGTGGITAEPCGQCNACRDIDLGRFVDYTELDAASNRGVDEVQSLLEQAVYKPVVGRYKVFMIDEVHMLTNTAFNAMLKTLEEPPEYLKFVLATTDPQKVPVTVLSRCIQFNLKPMAPDTIAEHLRHVLDAERIEAQTPALQAIAKAARGSMRDALSLTDQAIAYGAGQLQTDAVRQMLGNTHDGLVHAMLAAVACGDGAQVFNAVQALRDTGRSAASALEALVEALQRMALIQLAGVRAHEDEAALQTLAAALPPDQTQLLYSLCLNGRNELLLAPDEYTGLTMLLLRMLAFSPQGGQSARVEQLEGLKALYTSALAGGAAEAAKKPDPRPAEPARAVAEPVNVAERLPEPSEPATERIFEQNHQVVADFVDSDAINNVANESPHASDPGPAETDQPPTQPLTQPLADTWVDHVTQLAEANTITAVVRAFAEQCEWTDISHSAAGKPIWHLRCANPALVQGQSKDRLQAVLVEQFALGGIEVSVGSTSDSPAQRVAAKNAALMHAAEQAMLADPDVQHWMRQYGAKPIVGTLKPGPALVAASSTH
jgi:DNA polymerase III subunit gamma/tau